MQAKSSIGGWIWMFKVIYREGQYKQVFKKSFKRFQNRTFLLHEEKENEGKTSERWEKWFDVLRNTATEIKEDREK